MDNQDKIDLSIQAMVQNMDIQGLLHDICMMLKVEGIARCVKQDYLAKQTPEKSC